MKYRRQTWNEIYLQCSYKVLGFVRSCLCQLVSKGQIVGQTYGKKTDRQTDWQTGTGAVLRARERKGGEAVFSCDIILTSRSVKPGQRGVSCLRHNHRNSQSRTLHSRPVQSPRAQSPGNQPGTPLFYSLSRHGRLCHCMSCIPAFLLYVRIVYMCVYLHLNKGPLYINLT